MKLMEMKREREEIIYLKLKDCYCEREAVGDLGRLEDSIRTFGVFEPLVVDGTNKVLLGARRYYAAVKAGVSVIPVIRRELSDRERVMLEIEHAATKGYLPARKSEMCKTVATYYNAVKRQGMRNDLTSVPCAAMSAAERSSTIFKKSPRDIRRMVAVASLIPDLLGQFDRGNISYRTAELLTTFDESVQEMVNAVIEDGFKVTSRIVLQLKNFAQIDKQVLTQIVHSKANTVDRVIDSLMWEYYEERLTKREKESLIINSVKEYFVKR